MREPRGTQQAYVKASNTGFGDRFGFRVAVHGGALLVGAFEEDSDAVGLDGDQLNDNRFVSGAAYLFTRSGSTWTQRTYIKATNPDAQDRFAYRLALDGDTVVGTSYLEGSDATGINGDPFNNNAGGSGAVYAYR